MLVLPIFYEHLWTKPQVASSLDSYRCPRVDLLVLILPHKTQHCTWFSRNPNPSLDLIQNNHTYSLLNSVKMDQCSSNNFHSTYVDETHIHASMKSMFESSDLLKMVGKEQFPKSWFHIDVPRVEQDKVLNKSKKGNQQDSIGCSFQLTSLYSC